MPVNILGMRAFVPKSVAQLTGVLVTAIVAFGTDLDVYYAMPLGVFAGAVASLVAALAAAAAIAAFSAARGASALPAGTVAQPASARGRATAAVAVKRVRRAYFMRNAPGDDTGAFSAPRGGRNPAA